jgi:hypothetical protein
MDIMEHKRSDRHRKEALVVQFAELSKLANA